MGTYKVAHADSVDSLLAVPLCTRLTMAHGMNDPWMQQDKISQVGIKSHTVVPKVTQNPRQAEDISGPVHGNLSMIGLAKSRSTHAKTMASVKSTQ